MRSRITGTPGSTRWRSALAVGLVLLVGGCPGGEAGTGSGDTIATETGGAAGDVSAGTDGSGGESTNAASSSASAGTEPSPTTGADSSSGGTAAGEATSAGTGGAQACGICQPVCAQAADCCPPPSETPPGISCPDDFPFNFECPDGVCRTEGCASDADCAYFPGPMQICIVAADVGRCRRPCTSDMDCEATPGSPFPQLCDGVSELGVSYCGALAEPECQPAPDPAMPCTNFLCACVDEGDCPEGTGCTPAW